MSENELAKLAIGCGLKVHKALGPGLLENAYLDVDGIFEHIYKNKTFSKATLIEPSKASKGHLRRVLPLRCLLDALDGEKQAAKPPNQSSSALLLMSLLHGGN